MKKIAIIGVGGLGREILGIIQSINKENKTWDFIGFYDDNLSDQLVNNHSIIGNINDLNSVQDELAVIIGIGNPIVKEKIKRKIINTKINFPNLIHPSVVIYPTDTILLGKGIVIAPNCVLSVNIQIDDFVYINSLSVIAHDTAIGKYSMIMPTVSISAGAEIGERVYIGNGVKIDYPITIEKGSVIKAGTILTK